MSAAGFWDNPETAQDVGRKRGRVEKRINSGASIDTKSEELDVLLDLQKEGENVDADIESLVSQLEQEIRELQGKLAEQSAQQKNLQLERDVSWDTYTSIRKKTEETKTEKTEKEKS